MHIKVKANYISYITATLLSLIILSLAIPSIVRYSEKNQEISIERIEDTIKKYMLQCYATEGSYPADLEYLEKNYGLILDEEKYFYSYSVFASNIMPDIKVYLKKRSADNGEKKD